MSSLESCIRKAGPLLRKDDAEAIRKIRDDIYGAGDVTRSDANQNAVDEFIQILEEERDSVMAEIEKRGGMLAEKNLSVSEFAKQTAERIEDEARVFPKMGTQRKVGEKGWFLDMLPQSTEDLHKVLSQFDPEMANTLRANKADSEVYSEHIIEFLRTQKLPLRYKVEDLDIGPFEKAMVDANPKNPISVLHKHGANMQQAELETAPTPKTMRHWVAKFWGRDISKKAVLAAVPQNKLPEFIRYGMPGAEHYTKTMKEMNAFMETMMSGQSELADTWLKFNRKYVEGAKLLGELMHSSTLAGVDISNFQMPSDADLKKMSKTKRAMWKQRAEDYKLLKPFWDKLGKIGEQKKYEKLVWDAETDKESVMASQNVSEGQYLYMTVRDVYSNMRLRSIDGLLKRIEQTDANEATRASRIASLRALFETSMITPYFPLARFGEHIAVAKDPETGEVVGYFKRENRTERNKLVEELRSQEYIAYPMQDAGSNLDNINQVDPDFVAQVTQLLGEELEPGEGVLNLQDEIWQMYLKSLPEMSVKKAYIHRTGRLGFTHDALRSFGDHAFHGIHQLAKLKYGWELQEALKDTISEAEELTERASHIINMEKGLGNPKGYAKDEKMHDVLWSMIPEYRTLYGQYLDPAKAGAGVDGVDEDAANKARTKLKEEAEHDGPWAVPVAKELGQRHEYNLNPKSAAWATNLTAMGFLWFLSSSPAAGVLNLTQTAISAYPILRAEFNGQGAGKELLRASKQYAGSGEIHSGAFGGKLRNDTYTDKQGKVVENDFGEKAAFEHFHMIGTFSKTRARDLGEIAQTGSLRRDKTVEMVEYASYIFHKTEEANRMVTALAAYRLARKQYENDNSFEDDLARHDQAVAMADKMVEMSHYDYTNTNRPRIMQGDAGRVVFLFRNYSLNMQYRLIRDFRDGIWKNESIPKEDRRKARSRFMGIIGMTSIFTGLSGMPLFWAVEAMANVLLGDDDEPYDLKDDTRAWMAEAWGSKTAEVIMKGPWDAYTGMTMSSRTSLNNLWIREQPDTLRGKDLLLNLAGEGLGPIFGIGMNYAQGFQDLSEDHTMRGVEKMVPKAVADAMKTIRYAMQGAQNRQGDLIVPPEAFTSRDLFVQWIGFTPSNLSMQYEQNRAIKDREQALTRRHNQLLNRLFMGYRTEDRKMVRNTMQDIASWNKANPTYLITPASINRSAKARAQYDMRTVAGVAVDKRLQYLMNEMRFTPQ
jgi:hypothetical protein